MFSISQCRISTDFVCGKIPIQNHRYRSFPYALATVFCGLFPKKSPAGFWFPSLSGFLQIFLKKFSLFSKFPSVVKGILRERKVSHYEKASI